MQDLVQAGRIMLWPVAMSRRGGRKEAAQNAARQLLERTQVAGLSHAADKSVSFLLAATLRAPWMRPVPSTSKVQ